LFEANVGNEAEVAVALKFVVRVPSKMLELRRCAEKRSFNPKLRRIAGRKLIYRDKDDNEDEVAQ
jgi:hypothetical protein